MVLWIRADASKQGGIGHVMRTAAIVETLVQTGDAARYVTVDDPLARRLHSRLGHEVQYVTGVDDRAWLDALGADDVVLFDAYGVAQRLVDDVRSRVRRVALVDDLGEPEPIVDLVVNPNSDRVPARPGAAVLAGPAYALVASHFRERRRRRTAPPGRLVLTLGGTDPRGMTSLAAGRAIDAGCRDVVAVIGPGAADLDVAGIEVVRDPPAIDAVFDEADAAVTAAGSTTWQLLCMGVPTIVVETAANQRLIVEAAVSAGAALDGGSADDLAPLGSALTSLRDPRTCTALSERALDLVDGRGPSRVAAALLA
jgi:spore coat polysaccharide biosynthesis predicted glycosyltransferase SpsG